MAEPALRDALLQRMEDSLPAEIRLIIYSHLYELEYKPTRLGKNIHQIRTKTLWRTYWRTYRLPSFLTKYLHMDALLSHVNTEMEAHARNLPIVILCTEPANACMEDVMGLVEMARGYDLEETTHSRDTARAVIKPMAINAPLRWLEGYDVEGAEEMAGEKLPRILQAMKPFLEQTVYQLRRNQVIHIRWLVKMHHGGIADVWRDFRWNDFKFGKQNKHVTYSLTILYEADREHLVTKQYKALMHARMRKEGVCESCGWEVVTKEELRLLSRGY